MELSRSFKILSEKEISSLREKDRGKLPKGCLKSLLSVQVPSEADASVLETGYVFSHPQSSFRELKVKVVLDAKKEQSVMAADCQYFDGHAGLAWESACDEVVEESGVKDLLSKHATLPDLDEWCKECLNQAAEAGPGLFKGETVESFEEDNDDVELTGAAAASMPARGIMRSASSGNLSSVQTPPSTNKKPCGATEMTLLQAFADDKTLS
eukprot:6471820-Amphidinium_carterae.1